MPISINYKNSRKEGAPGGVSSLENQRTTLDAQLLPYAEALLAEWCGEVQSSGFEILMRNPLRDDQSVGSFKFNTQSGAWSDFAVPDLKGYGLTQLYSQLKREPLPKAMEVLAEIAKDFSCIPRPTTSTNRPEKPKVEPVNLAEVRLPPDMHPDLGFPRMKWEYRDAEGQLSFFVYRFDQDGKKETRPVAWSKEKNAWLWQYPAPPYPVYHLPELLARKDDTVIITEGEKTADAAARQFPQCVAITSACGADQAHRTDWAPLKGRTVILAGDKDTPGKHYAQSVAGAALAQGAKSVKVVDVWSLADWNIGDDLADHEVGPEFLDGAEDVFNQFEASELEPYVVNAAAWLSRGDFDRGKKLLSEHLAIGVRTFEGLVKEARVKDHDAEKAIEETDDLEDDKLEPWPDAVEGEALFGEIVTLIGRHVVLSESQAVAVACWIVFSYAFEKMRISPQLLINSPTKRCGKSTLLELIMSLVRRPLPAANISPAAVYRAIESWKPTLLIDEADTFLHSNGNEEITGILNSGHSRNLAYVVRTQEVEGDHLPVRFSTFCPKVIAMIKTPADTIIDRSIVITLARKLAAQRVIALTIDAAEQMKDTRRRILRWVTDNVDSATYDLEAVPSMGNDRARQNWAVLAAFSAMLGPAAHSALLKAVTELADTSAIEENLEVDLLHDIRELLASVKQEFVQSAVLVKGLLKMAERPWVEINRGKEINESKLARLLKPFKLAPIKFRDGAVTQRGYSIRAFRDVFDRYLTNEQEVAT